MYRSRAEIIAEDGYTALGCFGGGGTESTSSSSTTAQDQRVAATDQAIAVGPGGKFSINIQNPDGFAQLVAAGASIVEASLDFADGQTDKAYAFAAESRRSETQHLGLEALKAAGPILLIVGLGVALTQAAK